MKKIYMLLAIVCLYSTGRAQTSKHLNDSLIKQLDLAANGFKERYHSPSLVLLIVHGNDVIYSKAVGYADVENKIPATIETKYPILSMSKPFAATMLMQLVQQKKVRLDDDVRKYLPEFKQPNTTLLQLATHTSGLPRNSPADLNFMQQVDRWILDGKSYDVIASSSHADFLNSLKHLTYAYPKYEMMRYGDRHYSNLGYSMLGIALARAAKSPYTKYVTQHIFKPLGMDNSGFITDAAQKDTLVNGYWYDEQQHAYLKTPFFVPNSALYAGGIYATASDLSKFLSFQFQQQPAVLSDKYKSMMVNFNIGWKPAFPYVLHEGAMLGYRSEIVFNPATKLGWVILTNTTDFDFSKINDYISRLLAPYYAPVISPRLEQYIGTYQLEGNAGSLKIYLKDNKLYSNYLETDIPSTPLKANGNDSFSGPSKGNYSIGYQFIPNEQGEINILNMGQMTWRKM